MAECLVAARRPDSLTLRLPRPEHLNPVDAELSGATQHPNTKLSKPGVEDVRAAPRRTRPSSNNLGRRRFACGDVLPGLAVLDDLASARLLCRSSPCR